MVAQSSRCRRKGRHSLVGRSAAWETWTRSRRYNIEVAPASGRRTRTRRVWLGQEGYEGHEGHEGLEVAPGAIVVAWKAGSGESAVAREDASDESQRRKGV